MKKFRNKYRIPSARLQNWDYRWAGGYFITICTQKREQYFGKIENGNMTLSPIGVIADILWHEIKNHAQNVELGEFVVMPDHVHGILIITKNNNDVAVTKHAHRLGYKFEWQTRFYDHIIRNNAEFERISNYIINNPTNWNEDKFYEK